MYLLLIVPLLLASCIALKWSQIQNKSINRNRNILQEWGSWWSFWLCREWQLLLSGGPGHFHSLLRQPGVLLPWPGGGPDDGSLQTRGLRGQWKSLLRQQPVHTLLSSVWSLHSLCWREWSDHGKLWTFVILCTWLYLNKRFGKNNWKEKIKLISELRNVQLSCLISTQRIFLKTTFSKTRR